MPDQILGGIIINEILVDPNGSSANFDTDGGGAANATDEYVELRNVSASAIDISGLQLWDAGVNLWFTFPSGTILQPGAHALVMTGVQTGGALPMGGTNDLAFDAGRGSALLNNGAENVVVYDPVSDTFIQAVYNGDTLDDPTTPSGSNYDGFSTTATRIGAGEDFGSDVDGFSIQRRPDDTFVNNEAPTPAALNVCFCDGTRIEADGGPILVEDLAVGQMVQTMDDGLARVAWVYSRRLSVEDVNADPALWPVVIARGALGNGLPSRDLKVSQQHRLLVSGKIAKRMFDTVEVLVPAKALLSIDGIYTTKVSAPLSYFHVALENHGILFAEGAPAESFYPGKQALKALTPDARREFMILFPEFAGELAQVCRPVRPLVKCRRGRQLAMRHHKNNRPLVSAYAV